VSASTTLIARRLKRDEQAADLHLVVDHQDRQF
jgi:hypothetical protein